jgi:hypothetical protein
MPAQAWSDFSVLDGSRPRSNGERIPEWPDRDAEFRQGSLMREAFESEVELLDTLQSSWQTNSQTDRTERGTDCTVSIDDSFIHRSVCACHVLQWLLDALRIDTFQGVHSAG